MVTPRLATFVRASGALLLLSPVLIGAVLLGKLILEPPMHVTREDGSSSGGERLGPIEVGDRRILRLDESASGSSAFVVFFSTHDTRPEAGFEICAAGQCTTSTRRIDENSAVHLPLPAGDRSGEITVTLVTLRAGRLSYWGHGGQPLVRAPSERGWGRTLARAGTYFEAMAGDWLWPILVLHAAVLIAAFLVVSWRAAIER